MKSDNHYMYKNIFIYYLLFYLSIDFDNQKASPIVILQEKVTLHFCNKRFLK